jgi:hypothetical protein
MTVTLVRPPLPEEEEEDDTVEPAELEEEEEEEVDEETEGGGGGAADEDGNRTWVLPTSREYLKGGGTDVDDVRHESLVN